jgi:hypothetical protein
MLHTLALLGGRPANITGLLLATNTINRDQRQAVHPDSSVVGDDHACSKDINQCENNNADNSQKENASIVPSNDNNEHDDSDEIETCRAYMHNLDLSGTERNNDHENDDSFARLPAVIIPLGDRVKRLDTSVAYENKNTLPVAPRHDTVVYQDDEYIDYYEQQLFSQHEVDIELLRPRKSEFWNLMNDDQLFDNEYGDHQSDDYNNLPSIPHAIASESNEGALEYGSARHDQSAAPVVPADKKSGRTNTDTFSRSLSSSTSNSSSERSSSSCYHPINSGKLNVQRGVDCLRHRDYLVSHPNSADSSPCTAKEEEQESKPDGRNFVSHRNKKAAQLNEVAVPALLWFRCLVCTIGILQRLSSFGLSFVVTSNRNQDIAMNCIFDIKVKCMLIAAPYFER